MFSQSTFVRQKTPHPKELKAKAHKLFGATGRPGAVPGNKPQEEYQPQQAEGNKIHNGESNGHNGQVVGRLSLFDTYGNVPKRKPFQEPLVPRDEAKNVSSVPGAGRTEAEDEDESDEVRDRHCVACRYIV